MFPPADAWNPTEPQQSPTDFLQQEFRHRSAYNPYGYTFQRSPPAESLIKKEQNAPVYEAPEGQGSLQIPQILI